MVRKNPNKFLHTLLRPGKRDDLSWKVGNTGCNQRILVLGYDDQILYKDLDMLYFEKKCKNGKSFYFFELQCKWKL